MRRRDFGRRLGGMTAALSVPPSLSATHLKAADLPRIGVLDPGLSGQFAAFFAGMRDLGYVKDQNVTYVERSAAGQPDLIAQLAAELVAAKVAVIVTAGPLPVRAAMAATSTIPIVFAALGDALVTGVVSNLAHPDRNATGLSFLNTEIGTKRVELLHEMLPDVRRIAVLNDRNSNRLNVDTTLAAARAHGLEATVVDVTSAEEFGAAFEAMLAARAQALDALASPFFNANRERLVELAARHRLPAIYESAEYVRVGGLASYGAELSDLFRRASVYVDKILKGAKPADLPVQQPTTFELALNMRTAKVLGVTFPPSFLARADEVIE